jgi:hypothetical protein
MADNKEAVAFRGYLVKAGLYEQLDRAGRDFVEALCDSRDPAMAPKTRSSLLHELFGPEPKVGDAVTVADAFTKTAKTRSALAMVFSRWEKAGNKPAKIKEVPNSDMLMIKYQIVSLA